MGDTKSIFMSKGVWGAVAALIAAILAVALHLDPKQQADATGVILQGISAIGAALALYGRLTATHKLTLSGAASVTNPKE